MIALTWVMDLPRSVAMDDVRGRAARLGESLAAADGLLTGLACVTEAGVEAATQNSLALFTVWANSSRMSAFLWGEQMASVERDFARPSGRMWAVSSVQVDRGRLLKATHAGLAVAAEVPGQSLPARVDAHKGEVSRALLGKSTALALRGFDVAAWDEVSIDAWAGRPRAYDGRVFQVAAVAAPERS